MLTMANGGMVSDAPNCSTWSAAIVGLNAESTGAVTVFPGSSYLEQRWPSDRWSHGQRHVEHRRWGAGERRLLDLQRRNHWRCFGGTGAATVSGAGSAWEQRWPINCYVSTVNGTLNITNAGLVSDSCSGCAPRRG